MRTWASVRADASPAWREVAGSHRQAPAAKADIGAEVVAHLGRLGWSIAKLGNPRRGRVLLQKSLGLQPGDCHNWARLATTQFRILTGCE